MQKYQKTYLTGLGFDLSDTDILNNVTSEISEERADDIHHIKYLMDGINRQDYPFERLIALTREQHTKFGDKKQYFDYLLWMHWLNCCDVVVFDKKYLPNNIFFFDQRLTHLTALNFYYLLMERKRYCEVIETPDSVFIKIFMQNGELIETQEGETKQSIFDRKIINI